MVRALAAWLIIAAAACCNLAGCSAGSQRASPEDLGVIGDFSLTERSGRPIGRADLLGKVWVADFIFTRCNGPCPAVTGGMARLQKDLAAEKDVRLVSFSVDPEHDTTDVLSTYAGNFGADPERWLFVTGDRDTIFKLLRESFHVGVERNRVSDSTPGNAVTHSTRLVLVDRRGHIRGKYYEGATDSQDADGTKRFEQSQSQLRQDITALLREQP